MSAPATILDADKEIAELNKRIDDLVKVRARILELSPAARVATAIHSKQCHLNHTDGCGWEYESWSMPSYTRKRYLERAERMLAIEPCEEHLVAIIDAL